MTKRYYKDDTNTVYCIESEGDTTTVRHVSGLHTHVDELLTLRNTGNGFVSVTHAYSSTVQYNYICLDYDEAEYLYYAIGEALGLRKKKAKKVL